MQSKKLLIICGPTATGKTSLALKLAKKFDGVLISADSRQVYRGLDIGTGKDLPKNSKMQKQKNSNLKYYTVRGVRLYGYDLVPANGQFSVSDFAGFATTLLRQIFKENKLPIMVGGTGLYIKSVTDGFETIDVGVDKKLRAELEVHSPDELYKILLAKDPKRALAMNLSDRANPRRLIRAIEVAKSKKINTSAKKNFRQKDFDIMQIGLCMPVDKLCVLIKKRVQKRVSMGVEREIKKLIASGTGWETQSMTSLGYGVWKEYFENKITKDEVVERWTQSEVKYAKRQMVWFKKDKRINWYDTRDLNWQKKVEKLVKKWYSDSYGKTG